MNSMNDIATHSDGPKGSKLGKIVCLVFFACVLAAIVLVRLRGRDRQEAVSAGGGSGHDPSVTPAGLRVIDMERTGESAATSPGVHALVSGTITEHGLEELLRELYEAALNGAGAQDTGQTRSNLTVYAYTSRAGYRARAGRWIGRLRKTGTETPHEITLNHGAIVRRAAAADVESAAQSGQDDQQADPDVVTSVDEESSADEPVEPDAVCNVYRRAEGLQRRLRCA